MEIRKKRDGSRKVLLKDEDIRPVLFEYMEERYTPIRFFEELVLGRSRADAVMIAPSEEDSERLVITGFEIKSDKDQLNRLKKQSRNYSHFCDYNYLVTGEKYLDTADEEIPDTWGIYLVHAIPKEEDDFDSAGTKESGNIEEVPFKTVDFFVELIRPAKPTPRLRLSTQMKLLWRPELISIFRSYQLGAVSRLNKPKMAETIIERLGKEEAHRQMCLQLLDRDYTIWETKPAEKETSKPKKKKTKKQKPTEEKAAKRKTTKDKTGKEVPVKRSNPEKGSTSSGESKRTKRTTRAKRTTKTE